MKRAAFSDSPKKSVTAESLKILFKKAKDERRAQDVSDKDFASRKESEMFSIFDQMLEDATNVSHDALFERVEQFLEAEAAKRDCFGQWTLNVFHSSPYDRNISHGTIFTLHAFLSDLEILKRVSRILENRHETIREMVQGDERLTKLQLLGQSKWFEQNYIEQALEDIAKEWDCRHVDLKMKVVMNDHEISLRIEVQE